MDKFKEKYNQIIDEKYENYEKNAVIGDVIDSHYEPATGKWHSYIKEEFINRCKTNPEFSEKWGLKIEERKLSFEERYELYQNSNIKNKIFTATSYDFDINNIPTKLITITYNNETIESYE